MYTSYNNNSLNFTKNNFEFASRKSNTSISKFKKAVPPHGTQDGEAVF
jgi:hypothetical protein